jgi:hypothetical protein
VRAEVLVTFWPRAAVAIGWTGHGQTAPFLPSGLVVGVGLILTAPLGPLVVRAALTDSPRARRPGVGGLLPETRAGS